MLFKQDNENIGENIRLYRIKAGYSIKTLCKKIHYHHGLEIKTGSIRNYEKGAEKIPAVALNSIAAITGVGIKAFYEPADVSVLLDNSNKIHLLEAYCMISCRSEREALLHLTRQLSKKKSGGRHA